MKENESVEKLEVGKDYRVHCSKLIVIDRTGDFGNKGFYDDLYKKDVPCNNPKNWREATEEEVIEAFKRHLVYRYGEDWETMKIKEKHPNLNLDNPINDGSYVVDISKFYDGWIVWNENGQLYCNGIWVERLEEKEREMNVDELKIKAFLEGLEAENIEEFMRKSKISDYRNYGKAYVSAVRNKIEEKKPKPLFITDDGVEVFDGDVDVFTTNSSFNKYRFKAKRIKDSGLNHKIFYHESNLYNYIWRNKRVFSYEDFIRWGNVPYERVIKQLAKERIEK